MKVEDVSFYIVCLWVKLSKDLFVHPAVHLFVLVVHWICLCTRMFVEVLHSTA